MTLRAAAWFAWFRSGVIWGSSMTLAVFWTGLSGEPPSVACGVAVGSSANVILLSLLVAKVRTSGKNVRGGGDGPALTQANLGPPKGREDHRTLRTGETGTGRAPREPPEGGRWALERESSRPRTAR